MYIYSSRNQKHSEEGNYKKCAEKDIQKNFEKNHEEEKSNRVTSQCEPLGFIKICICMPCVFQGKIIADENHLGKGEALD